jgi:glycosyltransferase involved in cell wall biosynthesis
VKLAVVVQRYGADISGGAERLARDIAELLARRADVEVLTTRAKDYVSWRNELPAGVEKINGVPVRRFPVTRPRNELDFAHRSNYVFGHRHSPAEELRWLRSEGPRSPALIRHIHRTKDEFDFFLFLSFRYYQAFHGARAAAGKAVLVPTAERDPAVALSIFGPVFRSARAIMYCTPEERALVGAVSHRRGPDAVVGVSSHVPDQPHAGRFRKSRGIHKPFAIYVGRVDINKGCKELFEYFQAYAAKDPGGLDLVVIGSQHLKIPEHPRIHYLGFLSEQEKFDAMAAADLLIMPSPYESLSIVTLEAWALGKPVLVNGKCDVLRGQVLRSRGGLYYDNADEFKEGLFMLKSGSPAAPVLGRNGHDYFRRNYTWSVIERKYGDMFDRLRREPAQPEEPLPGFFARRRRSVPAAEEILRGLPSGPVAR